MILTARAKGVEVLAPAKLNLFLEVLAKRLDGFHEVATFIVAIGIFDKLQFEADSHDEIRISCVGSGGDAARESSIEGLHTLMGDVPNDRRNLAVRAVERLRAAASVRGGANITLSKRIPSAAGLGGASSDAAAALAAANYAWRLNWSTKQLADLGAEIGSDVPFFFGTGAAVCRGRGELIEYVNDSCPFHVVIVRPPAGLSTAAVYQRCRVPDRPKEVAPLHEALKAGDLNAVAHRMYNRLEDAACELSPWVARLRSEFNRLECLGHQMSGSGTSYFGICRNRHHARRVAARLRGRGFGYVRVASTLARFGETITASSQP